MALYLMAEPAGPTLDQFQELGARLAPWAGSTATATRT